MSSEMELEIKLEDLINEYKDFSNKNIYICGTEKMARKTQEVLLVHHADKERIKIQTL